MDLYTTDTQSATPLHFAVNVGDLAVEKALLASGADADAQGEKGRDVAARPLRHPDRVQGRRRRRR